MKSIASNISSWFTSLLKVWRREFRLVFSDVGVMLFFFFLPLIYPLIYTLIYNTENVKDIPIVVVDESRTPESRTLSRMLDATEGIKVFDYASNLRDARTMMNEHECYGILQIPGDYAKKIGRGTQSVATFYSDMGLLLRYRSFVSALTDVQLALGTDIQQKELALIGLPAQSVSGAPVNSQAIMLGDPTQGFASFIIPGILVLIIQQSMVLGVTMLIGGHKERRRRNGGVDPLAVKASPSATILGKMLCYVTIYIPILFYIINIVPEIFTLPHIGELGDYIIFLIPLLIASAFFGMTLGVLVKERESSMMVVVFTSVVFLFLSGLTWPRYAMNWLWTAVSDIIPVTWGVEGFIRLNSNGSTLHEQSFSWMMLWILSGAYMILAYLVTRFDYKRKLQPQSVKN